MIKRYIFVLIMITCMAFTLNAEFKNTAMSFLDIVPDARSEGRAGSFVAVADDAAGMNYWNPARLGYLNMDAGASFTHSQFIADIAYNYFAGYFGMGKYLNFGISGIMLGSEIEGSTIWDGSDIVEVSENDSASETAFGIMWGYRMTEVLSLGAGFKYAHESLKGYEVQSSGSALGFDLAAYIDGWIGNTTMGIVLKNLGSADYDGTEDSLPSKLLMGIAMDVWKNKNTVGSFLFQKVNVSSDFHFDLSGSFLNDTTTTYWNIGAEADFFIQNKISMQMRMGLRILDDIGGLAMFATGLGVEYMNIGVDYAFSARGDLGLLHRITLSYKMDIAPYFGSGRMPVAEETPAEVEPTTPTIEESIEKTIEESMMEEKKEIEIEESTEPPAEQPAEQPVEETVPPVEDAVPVEEPVEQPTEQPVEETVPPVETPTEESVEQPIEQPVEETVPPAEDAAPVEEPVEQPVEQPQEDKVEQPAEEGTEHIEAPQETPEEGAESIDELDAPGE